MCCDWRRALLSKYHCWVGTGLQNFFEVNCGRGACTYYIDVHFVHHPSLYRPLHSVRLADNKAPRYLHPHLDVITVGAVRALVKCQDTTP